MSDLFGARATNLAQLLGVPVSILGDGIATPDARRVKHLFAEGRAAEVSLDLDDAATSIGARVEGLAHGLAKRSQRDAMQFLIQAAELCKKWNG